MKILNPTEKNSLYLIGHKGALGIVKAEHGRLTLLRTSTSLARTTDSMKQSHYDYRERCLKDGSLREDDDPNLYRVIRDIEFDSPSALASFVEATNVNGHKSLKKTSRTELLQALKSDPNGDS